MGGILDTADIPGFLSNRDDMFNKLDTERETWVNFLQQWYTAHQGNAVTTSALLSIASVYDPTPAGTPDPPKGLDLLGDLLGDGKEHSRKIKLGKLIGSKVDRVYGEYRIVNAGEVSRAKIYRLEAV